MNDANSLQLVVLQGEQAGASTTLSPGCKLTVGATLDSDIVLRDPDLEDISVVLEVEQDRLHLVVASGEVDIDGEKLVAGDEKKVTPYTRLQLGNSVIACGAPESARWQEILAEHGSGHKNDIQANNPVITAVQPQSILQRRGSFFLFSFIGVALLLLLFGGGHIKKPQIDVVKQAEELAGEIRQLGFTDLQVKVGKDGAIAVHGYLDETKQRTALDALLGKHAVVVSIKVQVGEELAAEVKDIYRVQGISADVESLGPKKVKVTTQEGDVEHLQKVRAIAVRDAGLEDLVVSNKPPKAPSEMVQNLDPGKSVTMVVAGDPSYVVTTNQTRYFIGSLLPTGHRIAAITDAAVLLEKGGALTTLNF